MLGNEQLTVLFDLSLSLINEDSGSINLKTVLRRVLRVLNCSSGRVYSYYRSSSNIFLELNEQLPLFDSEMDQFIERQWGTRKCISTSEFNHLRSKCPKIISDNGVFYHLYCLRDFGFIILKRTNSSLDELFSKTLNRIFDKLALAIDRSRLKEEMKRSEHFTMIGEITSGIGHEIKNPLTALLLLIQRVQSSNNPLPPEKLKQYIDKMQTSATRILDIMNSLKALSKNQAEIPFDKVSIASLIQDCQFFIDHSGQKKKIKYSFPEDVPQKLYVRGRQVQLAQVILNLIKNSQDEIETDHSPWIKIEVLEKENIIEIKVVDSGAGIPLEVQQKMMLPFFTTKSEKEGTGLGLSIGQRILETHEGSLNYDASAEHTTFSLELPKFLPEISTNEP